MNLQRLLGRHFSSMPRLLGTTATLSSAAPAPKLLLPLNLKVSKVKPFHSKERRADGSRRYMKLKMLASQQKKVEFQLMHGMKVKDLKTLISREYEGQTVSILKEEGSEAEEEESVAQILQAGEFKVKIEGVEVKVLADPTSFKQVKNFQELFMKRILFDYHECKNVPFLEETVLKFYLDFVLQEMKAKKTLTKEDILQLSEKAKEISVAHIAEFAQKVQEKLQKHEKELAELEGQETKLKEAAQNYSSKALWLSLLVVTVQLIGFYALIYHLYSWDEMEPFTYLLGVVYSLIGVIFYKMYRGDLELLNARQILTNSRFTKLSMRSGFDSLHKQELARQVVKLQRILKIIAR